VNKCQSRNKILFSFPVILGCIVILSVFIFNFSNQVVVAAGKYTINPKINIKNLNNPQKLKLVAYSNGVETHFTKAIVTSILIFAFFITNFAVFSSTRVKQKLGLAKMYSQLL
jgi:hypothetical protein